MKSLLRIFLLFSPLLNYSQCQLFFSNDTAVNVLSSDSSNLPFAALIGESNVFPLPLPTFQTLLPDGIHQTYTIGLEVNHSQGIYSQGDSLNISLFMEHSNLGDLEVRLICPNGNAAVLINAYSGAGELIPGGFGGDGNFLGDANVTSTAVGLCDQYIFSSDTNSFTSLSDGYNLVMVGWPSSGVKVESGSYSAEDGFSNLIGCPYQGTWILEVTDYQQNNDGWICDLDFLTLKYPQILFEWMPNIGLSNNKIRNPRFYSDTTIQYQLIATDGFCIDTIDYLVEVEHLDVKNKEFASFTFFPNPVSGSLILNFAEFGNYTVSLYNLSGQKLKQNKVTSNTTQFSLESFQNGIYILEVYDLDSKEMVSKKVEVLR